MMEIKNMELKEGRVVVKDLMVTDYNDLEIGTNEFEVGSIVVIHSKDESDNALAVITAVVTYYENPERYEEFLAGDKSIQEFLGHLEADGSAEWITDDDQILVCWNDFAKITKPVSFEDAKSWC